MQSNLIGETIGKRVLILRTIRGWTQDELAEKSNVTQVTICYLETGRTKNPHPRTIHKLAQAFDVTVYDLGWSKQS